MDMVNKAQLLAFVLKLLWGKLKLAGNVDIVSFWSTYDININLIMISATCNALFICTLVV